MKLIEKVLVGIAIVGALVGIGAGLDVAFFSVLPNAAAQQLKEQKWEYKVELFQPEYGRRAAEATKQLNTLANDGWEYVGLVAVPGGTPGNPPRQDPSAGYVAFKRLKK